MAKLRVTDRAVKALKPRASAYDKGFGAGFYIRVHPEGGKTARYRYALAGKKRVLTLGEYGTGVGQFTLAKLINKHTAAQGEVAKSNDPALERDKKREAVAIANVEHEGRLTLKALCTDFQDNYNGRGGRGIADKTRNEYRKHIEGIIVPKWGKQAVEALPVALIITDMRSLPPVQANRLYTTLNLILNWSVKNGLATHNPLAGRDKPGGAEKSKNRALDFDPETETVTDSGEIKAFWDATKSLSGAHRDALRLILLSGQRPGEVLSLRKGHVKDKTWRVPAAVTKNKKGVHVVPVTKMMAEIITPLANSAEDYLFPNKFGNKPVLPNILAHKLADMLSDAGKDKKHPLHGIAAFTPHDLRRSCATQLGTLGYVDAEIGLLLNHSTAGVTGIYNRASAEERIRPMLEAWHRRLKVILGGKQQGDVVPLRAKR